MNRLYRLSAHLSLIDRCYLETFLLCQYKYFFFVHLLCSSAFVSFSLCGQYRQ